MGGCSSENIPTRTELASPLVPVYGDNPTDSVKLIRELQQCLDNSSKNTSAGPVAELLLTYVNAGRDFSPPEGADGYVLRVIPLDNKYRPLRIRADVEIILIKERLLKNDERPGMPVCRWRVAGQDLDAYWAPSALPESYLLRLDWGEREPGTGNYQFLVRFAYKHKKQTITLCRKMTFTEL